MAGTQGGLELLAEEAADVVEEGSVSEVVRPSAIVPEGAARLVLQEMSARDVRWGGTWWAEPTSWRRYDVAFDGPAGTPGAARLLGSLQVAYGTPTRYEITVYRATVTPAGVAEGLTVASLCAEALAFGGLDLDTCPRAALRPPPPPFRFGV